MDPKLPYLQLAQIVVGGGEQSSSRSVCYLGDATGFRSWSLLFIIILLLQCSPLNSNLQIHPNNLN